MSKKKDKKKLLILMIATIIFIAAIILIAVKSCGNNGETDTTTTSEVTTTDESQPVGTVNPLTGLSGFDKSKLGTRPVAIVISNAPAARPQWGICTPDILTQMLVEGGMTRFIGLFSDVDKMPKMGPVRSARHDFIEYAQGFDAIFVHWGGSKYAYSAIKTDSRNIDNIDGMDGTYFRRDKSRSNVGIEHRGYTTGEDISKAIQKKDLNTKINDSFKSILSFNPENSPMDLSGGICQKILFRFSGSSKNEFKYNSDKNLYYFSQNGKEVKDSDGVQYSSTNVIVLYCDISSMGDNKGCVDIDLSSGVGIVASNGTFENITWSKGEYNDTLKLFAQAGSEFTLNAGKSYVGFVPNSQSKYTSVS